MLIILETLLKTLVYYGLEIDSPLVTGVGLAIISACFVDAVEKECLKVVAVEDTVDGDCVISLN